MGGFKPELDDPELDDEGNVDVEYFPIPPGLREAWDELHREDTISKAGPYIGPRGGKWADPQHKIPWDDDPAKRADRRRKEKRAARKEKRKPADWATDNAGVKT